MLTGRRARTLFLGLGLGLGLVCSSFSTAVEPSATGGHASDDERAARRDSADARKAEAPKGGWSSVEKGLRKAAMAGDLAMAKKYLKRLDRTGAARAYRSMIRYGMGGEAYEIYTAAAGYLAQLEQPEHRRVVFEELATHKNFRIRIILLAVVKRWVDDPEAMAALHARLRDRRKEVVFTALRWVRELKRPELSMEPLIDALEAVERKAQGRLYFDLKKALEKLSGGQKFDVAADWRNFWKVRQAGGAAPAPKKKGRTELYKRPSFFSLSVDTDRVLFIIDTSQSMLIEDPVKVLEPDEEPVVVLGSGTTVVRLPVPESEPGDDRPREIKRTRMSAVQKELVRTLKGLPSSTRFNIFSFNHESAIFDGSSGLIPASARNKSKAIDWVRGLKPYGLTRTDLVLQQALQLPEVDTILLLTDGAPKGLNNQKIPHDLVFSLTRQLNRFRRCRINTIGFLQAGTSMRSFVEKLAAQNDGKCVLLD